MFDTLLPYLLAGISVGGQYALIAVGYTLVYGILRLINFAHGDIFTAAGFFMVYLVASVPLSLAIPLVTIVTPVLTIALVVALVMLINHTKIGMAMRAVSVDFETSQLMGIKINNVISVTFIIGSAMAAIGSLLYFTNYTAVTPTVGAMPGLKAFVAAVFGGIGSIPGAMIGALIIGICENLIKAAGWTAFSDAFTFALLIVVLLFRPTGLFGEKTTDKV